jgi:hypothetical protein
MATVSLPKVFTADSLSRDPKYNTIKEYQDYCITASPQTILNFNASINQWMTALTERSDLFIHCPFAKDSRCYSIALKKKPSLVIHIKDATEEMQLCAITADPYLISQMNTESTATWVSAVSRDGNLLKHCKNQNESIIIAALEQNPAAFTFVEKKYESHLFLMIGRSIQNIKYFVDVSKLESLERIFKLYPDCIEFTSTQAESLQMISINHDSSLFRFCRPEFPKVLARALELDPKNARYARTQTIEMARAAIKAGCNTKFIIPSILDKIQDEENARDAAEQAARQKADLEAKQKADEQAANVARAMKDDFIRHIETIFQTEALDAITPLDANMIKVYQTMRDGGADAATLGLLLKAFLKDQKSA